LIRNMPLEAPRIRSRPLAAEQAGSTHEKMRKRPLGVKASRISSRRLAAERGGTTCRQPGLAAGLWEDIKNRPLAARIAARSAMSWHDGDGRECFVRELIPGVHRRPLAAKKTLLVHGHIRLTEARARRRLLAAETTLPVHLRPEGAARVARRPLAATQWSYFERLVRLYCRVARRTCRSKSWCPHRDSNMPQTGTFGSKNPFSTGRTSSTSCSRRCPLAKSRPLAARRTCTPSNAC